MDNIKDTMAAYEKYESEVSTNVPISEIIQEESHQIITVVVFVISAVLVITLIFIMAVFIDCRQQKIQESSKLQKLRKRMKGNIQRNLPTLPTIGESSRRDDERTIVNNMEIEPSSSQANIV